MYFLGIDVGTGGSRAVLIDDSGLVAASVTEEHAPFASPRIGWAEQEPEDWWRAASAAIRKILAEGDWRAEEIVSIGLSGQMHGAVLLDGSDSVLRPSIIWCDQRTTDQCDKLTESIGKTKLIELVANPALPNFTLPKLLWVRENEPAIWNRVTSFLLPKDFVRFRMTGEKATDVADGSGTLMLDVRKRKWSDAITAMVGIETDILPSLYESHEVTGTISASCAAETGLKAGTPVVAGAGDNAAGAIGMGIVSPGDISATIGTSGVVFAVTDTPKIDPLGRIHTLCHAIPDTWHVTGVTQAAGLSLQWFRNNFGGGESYDTLVEKASEIDPGAEGLFWTPYLMGERTPHVDASARASLIGLTASHSRAHVVRAILEGVAFSLRDCLEVFRESGIPIGKIRLGGGGSKSALWRQIQADVYGTDVETIAAEEGAAFGAAILAGVGYGAWESVADACDAAIQIDRRLYPRDDIAAVMERQYASYKKIYPALYGLIGESARSKGSASE